jgi:uncharacterized membrane protein
MADPTLIVLRIVHIFAGVFWAGTVFFLVRFLMPAIEAGGPAGGEILKLLFLRFKIGIMIPVAAMVTVLAGIWLYVRNVMGSNGAWARSIPGTVYGIGGAAAIIALIAGASMIGPSLQNVVVLSEKISSEGRAPSSLEMAEIARLKAKSALGTKIAAALLAIAVVTMAIGRYV